MAVRRRVNRALLARKRQDRTQEPEAEAEEPPRQEPLWYYARDRQAVGPVSIHALLDLARAGGIQAQTQVREDRGGWMAAGAVPQLREALAAAPAPVPAKPPPNSWYYQDEHGRLIGPLPPSGLRRAVEAGQIHPHTRVKRDDSPWLEALQVRGLLPPPPQAQPLTPRRPATGPLPPSTATPNRSLPPSAVVSPDVLAISASLARINTPLPSAEAITIIPAHRLDGDAADREATVADREPPTIGARVKPPHPAVAPGQDGWLAQVKDSGYHDPADAQETVHEDDDEDGGKALTRRR